MEKFVSFETAEQSGTEPRLNRNPAGSTSSKCVTTKARASFFESGKINKNVLPIRKKRKAHFLAVKLNRQFPLASCNDILEVVRKGTKLMKSINFPTVIVQLRTGSLKKATLYYVILEIETEGYEHKLPAVMFSNPYVHGRTKLAELLPLSFVKCSISGIRLAPMMSRKRYRCAIRKGFCFKMISLTSGGALDGQRENTWNRYNTRITAIRNQLGRFLEKDISQLALLLEKKRTSSKCIYEPRNGLQKYAVSRQKTFRPTLTMDTGKEENLRDKGPSPSSKFFTNKVEPKVCNGCTLQLSLNAVDLKEDNLYYKRAILSKYPLNDLSKLPEYKCVSDFI